MARTPAPAKEMATAIDALERRVAAQGRDARLRLQIAVLHVSLHGWKPEPKLVRSAREQLQQAIELDPRLARAHALLGYVQDLEGHLEEALACFREAHRLDPRDKIYEVYRFRLLTANGREKEALAAIALAAPRHPVHSSMASSTRAISSSRGSSATPNAS